MINAGPLNLLFSRIMGVRFPHSKPLYIAEDHIALVDMFMNEDIVHQLFDDIQEGM